MNKEQLIDSVINRFTYNLKTGDIYSSMSNINKSLGNVDKGYLVTCIGVNGKRLGVKIHRLAWRLYHGEWPKETINHIDGNKLNNRIENLEDVTQAENIFHKEKILNKNNKGENHGKVKLTESDIINIRYLFNINKYSKKELAKIYNTTRQNINRIIKYKTWKHI